MISGFSCKVVSQTNRHEEIRFRDWFLPSCVVHAANRNLLVSLPQPDSSGSRRPCRAHDGREQDSLDASDRVFPGRKRKKKKQQAWRVMIYDRQCFPGVIRTDKIHSIQIYWEIIPFTNIGSRRRWNLYPWLPFLLHSALLKLQPHTRPRCVQSESSPSHYCKSLNRCWNSGGFQTGTSTFKAAEMCL